MDIFNVTHKLGVSLFPLIKTWASEHINIPQADDFENWRVGTINATTGPVLQQPCDALWSTEATVARFISISVHSTVKWEQNADLLSWQC